MQERNVLGPFFLGLFIAVGIATGGYFIGQTMYNAKVALNTAEAKGLAERRVKSDRATWTIEFSVAGASKSEVPKLYEKAEKQQKQISEILNAHGFEKTAITSGVIDYRYQEYRDENQNLIDQKHILNGGIHVETENVALISSARSKINKLIAQGIQIQNHAPSYYFTKLNDIKPEMLREATKNARIAANEFAENAGVTVGGIRSARQGNFFVRDASSEYGDTAKIEKDVRVVTTITFYLTE